MKYKVNYKYKSRAKSRLNENKIIKEIKQSMYFIKTISQLRHNIFFIYVSHLVYILANMCNINIQ